MQGTPRAAAPLFYTMVIYPPGPDLTPLRQATTYDLPGPGHTYGKALERDREDAGAVVASWQEHVKNPQAQPGVDFRALNRDAIIQVRSFAIPTIMRGFIPCLRH